MTRAATAAALALCAALAAGCAGEAPRMAALCDTTEPDAVCAPAMQSSRGDPAPAARNVRMLNVAPVAIGAALLML
jgi:hypothetical protein